MSAEVSFDSNIIQLLLIIGIILLMGGYFYYENLKIKNQLLEFEYKLNKFSESLYPGNQLNEQDISKDIQMESFHPKFSQNFEGEVVSERDENEIMEHEEIHDGLIMSEEPMKDEISDEWKNISDQMKNVSDSETESGEKKLNYISDEVGLDEVGLDDVNGGDEQGEITNEDDLLKSFTIDEMLNDINSDEKKDLNQDIQDEIVELDYKGMTVSQLKNILVEKNLPVSGNKTKLIQRILDNDK